MTIYKRISLSLSLLTMVTLGTAFAAISMALDRYQERELDAALLEVARSEAREAPANGFSFSTGPGPAANDVGPLDKYGIIFDEYGAVLSATQPFDTGTPNPSELKQPWGTPFDFTFGNRRFRGVVVAVPGYEKRSLLLAASREDLDSDSGFLRQAMAIALAVSVAWLLGAIRWLVRRSMRDHERIADLLHQIASGDTDVRLSNSVADKDLRRLGSDIDEIAARLAALVDHQRRFIAHAAHELRSPLAALHGEIQQSLRKKRSVEEHERSLAFLLKASGRLKHLADELLELARADAKTEPATSVDVARVLADVVESLAPLATEKNVQIQVAPTGCTVVGNARELERILRNLLDNAIRHSPNGGLVRLDTEASELVRIRVRDQGRGVAESERERIFEPFHRSPEARSDSRGAGLGLAIARELARKYGGDVTVGAERGCFVVTMKPSPGLAREQTTNPSGAMPFSQK